MSTYWIISHLMQANGQRNVLLGVYFEPEATGRS